MAIIETDNGRILIGMGQVFIEKEHLRFDLPIEEIEITIGESAIIAGIGNIPEVKNVYVRRGHAEVGLAVDAQVDLPGPFGSGGVADLLQDLVGREAKGPALDL